MKKRVLAVCMAMVLGMTMTACGKHEPLETAAETQTEVKTEETQAEVKIEETQETTKETEAQTIQEITKAPETAETVKETAEQQTSEGGYEDNFAVDVAAAEEFANKVKEAVANKDLEALADLNGYPLYVGFSDGSETPTSRDEFIALTADRIFTSELLDSVANADVSNLSPSMAGFVISSGSKPNIIFGVRDGALLISGYNY